ncbi:hypothetical protein B0H17DRAFT_1333964 [Mycena rosella]|uniref:Uncharacterized protein n=1 Tax=Mycena rosella TaxID=1033263 RepID=A0AAD7D571_MYCRO|nr:hypothetical protein B0H17DRAFT_1333964 [Mycena rosella]
MGYYLCADNARTTHKPQQSPPLPNSESDSESTPLIGDELYCCLSTDVDFSYQENENDLDDLELETLELGYPDDTQDIVAHPQLFTAPETSPNRLKNRHPPSSPILSDYPPNMARETPESFSSSAALIQALHSQLEAFDSAAQTPADSASPIFVFHGEWHAYPQRDASPRILAGAVKNNIEAACGVRFRAGLPPAPITGGVLVRSVCTHAVKLKGTDNSMARRTKTVRGMLDVAVVAEADGSDGCWTTVQFRLLQ